MKNGCVVSASIFLLIRNGWEGLSLFLGGSKLRSGTEAKMKGVISDDGESA
jgi:hypothetical protein